VDERQAEARAINQLKAGDIGGPEVLVKRYYVKAVRSLYLITRERALAEDLVQSAFIRAYARISE
jgi:RNA polymerase sigma-70 factor, ECF subfamily